MEEKKNTQGNSNMKVVGGQEVNNTENKEQRKATYEELNNYCIQLYNQNRQLVEQLRQRDMSNMLRRLDFLFQVLSHKDCFDDDFIKGCSDEIRQALTLDEHTDSKGKAVEEGKEG